MYQAIFPDGRIECAEYERTERGVELYDADENFLAFVPYANLHAVIDAEGQESEEVPPFVA